MFSTHTACEKNNNTQTTALKTATTTPHTLDDLFLFVLFFRLFRSVYISFRLMSFETICANVMDILNICWVSRARKFVFPIFFIRAIHIEKQKTKKTNSYVINISEHTCTDTFFKQRIEQIVSIECGIENAVILLFAFEKVLGSNQFAHTDTNPRGANRKTN